MKKLFVLALALMLGCTAAMAAVFPSTPTVYIGYGAGGGTDTAVRPVVAAMADYLGETINCVNMEGANSAVACDYVLEQPHDGTSMFATGTGGFSSYPIYAYSTSSWQDWISFHPYSGPAVVFANKDAGVTNTQELFDYLAAGNKLTYAHNGTPALADLLALKAAVLKSNVRPEGMCFVMSETMKAILEATPKWQGAAEAVVDNNGRINGIPVFTTGDVDDKTVDFGCFKYAPQGLFGEMSFIVDPYSLARKNAVDFVLNVDYAITVLRQCAFATLTEAAS